MYAIMKSILWSLGANKLHHLFQEMPSPTVPDTSDILSLTLQKML